MTAVVVPGIPAVTLPDGVYYTQRSFTGWCDYCDRSAVAVVSWITCEWRATSPVAPLPETNVGRHAWACPAHLVSTVTVRRACDRPAPGTDVTVELDKRWLAIAGVGELPTFVRRAS